MILEKNGTCGFILTIINAVDLILYALINAGGRTLKLKNGTTAHEGRVEVLHHQIWGTVCEDLWDLQDADVVCKMLGYPGALNATTGAYFGEGRGPVVMSDVICAGHEGDIDECEYSIWKGDTTCKNGSAGVICKGTCMHC